MTEDEIVQKLLTIDAHTAQHAASSGPFSVFRLQSSTTPTVFLSESTWPLEEVSNGSTFEIDDHSMPASRNQNIDPVIVSQPLIAENGPASLSLPPHEEYDGPSHLETSSINSPDRHLSVTEESSHGVTTQSPSTESTEEVLYNINNSTEQRNGDPSGSLELVTTNTPGIEFVLSEFDHTLWQFQRSMDMFGAHQSVVSTDVEVSFADVSLIRRQQLFPRSIIGNLSAAMLINHYTNHTVHLMQPIFHRENPFQTLYLPLASKGLSELEIAQGSQHVYSASIAVFHSLMAIAAINLQGLESGSENLQQLACHHKQQALIALRNALAQKTSKYKDLMIAILSMVSADVSYFRLNLRAKLMSRLLTAVFMTIGSIWKPQLTFKPHGTMLLWSVAKLVS